MPEKEIVELDPETGEEILYKKVKPRNPPTPGNERHAIGVRESTYARLSVLREKVGDDTYESWDSFFRRILRERSRPIPVSDKK